MDIDIEKKFKKTVIDYFNEKGRVDLPWRKNQSPYFVLVSEIMLQQTQVDRVIPFFKRWVSEFPSLAELASAKQTEVLFAWKGLGYNSRAIRLQKCAQEIVSVNSGIVPDNYESLLKLPGIGPYTAAAVMNFAFSTWTPLIETNIRRVYIHHFFRDKADVTDSEILEKVKELGFVNSPEVWCAALMDYGATLPKILKKNPNTQSKHYSKQSKFEGSDRQIRARILEILLNEKKHKLSLYTICRKLGAEKERYILICKKLEKENFIYKEKNSYSLVE